MNGKILILIGIIISTLFIYLCIDTKKDALYAALYHDKEKGQTSAEAKQPAQLTHTVQKKLPASKEPSFAYVNGKVAALFASKDKNSSIMTAIDTICKTKSCSKEIKFYDNIKPFSITKETIALIDYAKKENINDFGLYIDKNSVKIEGELKTQEQKDMIQSLLTGYQNANYTVENTMQEKNLIPLAKETIVKEEITEEKPKNLLVTPTHTPREVAAANIDEIIGSNPITFDYKSSNISKESQTTLDKVVDILLELDNVKIEVAGYTDSKGNAVYNKVLSQKRADAVQKYLIKAGIQAALIKAVGYGEEDPISTPTDIINRRVEIHLNKGE